MYQTNFMRQFLCVRRDLYLEETTDAQSSSPV
jgi:hypothetical protein